MATEVATSNNTAVDIKEKAESDPLEVLAHDIEPVRGTGLTKRIRAVIELMVFYGKSQKDATREVGLTDEAVRQAFRKPQVLKHLRDEQEVLRASLRPRALQRIGELSDKSKSEKVGLDAAKYLDSNGNSDRHQVSVGVQVNVAPGYLIDVSNVSDRSRQIAEQAGSTANCIDGKADVLTDE